jgi:hypothetical protein
LYRFIAILLFLYGCKTWVSITENYEKSKVLRTETFGLGMARTENVRQNLGVLWVACRILVGKTLRKEPLQATENKMGE